MYQHIYEKLERLVRRAENAPQAIGYQQLTVAGSVVQMTIPSGANYALLVVESTIAAPSIAIRYTENGTTPAAGTGMPKGNTDAFEILSYQNIQNFKAIQEAVGTHKLNITYYKI